MYGKTARSGVVQKLPACSGNSIAANSTIDFEYVETVPAVEGDVVINEFLADPVDNNNDFVELYNRSDKFLDLAGWKVADESSTSDELPSFVLRPASFVIIYDEDASADYPSFGDALSIPSLTLNKSDPRIRIIKYFNLIVCIV